MASIRYSIYATAPTSMTIEQVGRMCSKLRPYGVDTLDSDMFNFSLEGEMTIDNMIYEQAVKIIKILSKSGMTIVEISTMEGRPVYDSDDREMDIEEILDFFEQFDMNYDYDEDYEDAEVIDEDPIYEDEDDDEEDDDDE